MKTSVLALAAVLATLSVAQAAEHQVTFENVQASDGPLVRDARNIDARSDRDGVCRYLGAKTYVFGSAKTGRVRIWSNGEWTTFETRRFAVLNEDGQIIKRFESKDFQPIGSKLSGHLFYKTWSKRITRISCLKD